MKKKILFGLVATIFLSTGSLAEAQQQRKVHRIGSLRLTGQSTLPARYEAFRQGLLLARADKVIKMREGAGERER